MPVVQTQRPIRYHFGSESGPHLAFRELEQDRQSRELLEHNRRLAAENARLAEENHALREAADLWIRLYERQLGRANEAIHQER